MSNPNSPKTTSTRTSVKPEEIAQFIKDYAAGKYPHERYGQAFMNHFNIEGPDSGLFYEQSEKVCLRIICEYYMELEEVP